MTTHNIMVSITVDETNPDAPSLEDILVSIQGDLEQPDNDHFGIKAITVSPIVATDNPNVA